MTDCIPTPAAGRRVLGKNASATRCACLAGNQKRRAVHQHAGAAQRRSISSEGCGKTKPAGQQKGRLFRAQAAPALIISCHATTISSRPAGKGWPCELPAAHARAHKRLPGSACQANARPRRARARRYGGSPAAPGVLRGDLPAQGRAAGVLPGSPPRAFYDVTVNCTLVGMSPCARSWMALPATSVVPAPLVICTSSGDAGSALPSHTAP